MNTVRTVLSLALLGSAAAHCPNACSGHGTCGADDLCTCYQNWGMADENGGDCSEMYCPYEIAFVDAPNAAGLYHKYMECSGKGICDRSTGECECFEGYTGKGCQRTACPNDCSGHGTCEYMEELTYGSVPGLYWGSYENAGTTVGTDARVGYDGIYKTAKAFPTSADNLWDYHKSMACVCDAGWIDVDCSRRMCPKANDVMDERLNIADDFKYQLQNITLYAAGPKGDGMDSAFSEFYGNTFALTFVSKLNESFTTIPIEIKSVTNEAESAANLGAKIESALKNLPNKVVNNVNVNCTFGYEERDGVTTDDGDLTDVAFLNMEFEFVGSSVMGPQNLLIVEARKCSDGCTPKISGLNLISVDMTNSVQGQLSIVSEKQAADYNNYECGRRGKCDYDKGLCECFEGYTGEACSIQTALV